MRVLLPLSVVCQRVSLSPTTIRDLVREGKFPKPVKLPARRVAWASDEIDGWIDERLSERA
ncbi:AlpA family phage regulatory protein [Chelativorans sp. ZYF759]|uniref:helix-turn-helix transcriptional regulator n=1 Tax=Chelativorans sp. ZYF759 TaxID=2692213 RepID=UPI00145EB0AE|nr:AlpA family phage regulatory protein [Chelativorans sp. ZYF759]NMG40385.1 AlpA family phage regulatory protein [Chelativorans sp. ZYF759]